MFQVAPEIALKVELGLYTECPDDSDAVNLFENTHL